MANWVYEKWNCKEIYTYSYYEASNVTNIYRDVQHLDVYAYQSYTFNNTTGYFAMSQGIGTQNLVIYMTGGQILYGGGGSSMDYYKCWSAQRDERKIQIIHYQNRVNSTTYSKGTTLIGEVEAPDGTYPDNGRASDGYWYVKVRAAGPKPPSDLHGVASR